MGKTYREMGKEKRSKALVRDKARKGKRTRQKFFTTEKEKRT